MIKQAGTELWMNGKKYWLLNTVTMTKVGPYFDDKEEAIDFGIHHGRWIPSIKERLLKEDVDGKGDPESMNQSSNKNVKRIASSIIKIASGSPIAKEKKLIGLVINYLDLRHKGNVKEAKRIRDMLIQKLGKNFEKVLMFYGNPDKDYIGVRNSWAMEFEGIN